MTGLCSVGGCSLIARVTVQDAHGEQLEVCVPHWKDAVEVSLGDIRGVRLLKPPRCAHAQCTAETVTVVGRYDEPPKPVCQRHLDDLSWVELPTENLGDAPGWSGG